MIKAEINEVVTNEIGSIKPRVDFRNRQIK